MNSKKGVESVDKIQESNLESGCLSSILAFILFIVFTMISLNGCTKLRDSNSSQVGLGFVILTIGYLLGVMFICFIPAIIHHQIIKYKLNSENVSQEEKNLIMENIKRNERYAKQRSEREKESENRKANSEAYLEDIEYVGGHHEYSSQAKGSLYLYDAKLDFYSNHTGNQEVKCFTIYLNQIEDMKYDLEENFSVGKFVLFGLASMAMKNKRYYLGIEYLADNGLKNQAIFSMGSTKKQEFFNKLNVQRNNVYVERSIDDSYIDTITKLADLKEKGILTEEEFSNRKREILEKL